MAARDDLHRRQLTFLHDQRTSTLSELVQSLLALSGWITISLRQDATTCSRVERGCASFSHSRRNLPPVNEALISSRSPLLICATSVAPRTSDSLSENSRHGNSPPVSCRLHRATPSRHHCPMDHIRIRHGRSHLFSRFNGYLVRPCNAFEDQ